LLLDRLPRDRPGGSAPGRGSPRRAGRDRRAGTRLPPERDLAAEYGVAYNTLRQAIDMLRERGLAVTLCGHGNYVRPGVSHVL